MNDVTKPAKSAAELKKLIAEELKKIAEAGDFDEESVVILGGHSGWLATLRQDGPRIDESRFAAVSEISRRLAAGYDLCGTVN
jgi:hypothetical protein